MSARALRLWRENERLWKKKLLHPTGVLFMAAKDDDAFERGSIPYLEDAKIPHKQLSRREMQRCWPQINLDGIDWGLYEPKSGYLTARAACQAVVDGFIAEGGNWKLATVRAAGLESDSNGGVTLTDGSKIRAHVYVFACGPWMGSLFPETIGPKITATKQDVFFFGTPSDDRRFNEGELPVWADHRGRFMYGIPGNGARTFKVADDTRGPEFDPTSGERVVSQERLRLAREYVEFRFPGMKGAPLIKGRVCQGVRAWLQARTGGGRNGRTFGDGGWRGESSVQPCSVWQSPAIQILNRRDAEDSRRSRSRALRSLCRDPLRRTRW
jgi:glycine/D-amino acid oxidase-like deaminating enzyme